MLDHDVSEETPAMFQKTLYPSVARLPNLPRAASEICQRRPGEENSDPAAAAAERKDRFALIASLYAADAPCDGCEPGWSALAYWIEETNFLQVLRRAEYLKDGLDGDPNQYIDSAVPLIPHHRFRPVVESIRPDARSKRVALIALKKIPISDLDLRQIYVSEFFRNWDEAERGRAWMAEHDNEDPAADDLLAILPNSSAISQPDVAEELIKISPHCPTGWAALFEGRWDKYKDRAQKFMPIAREHPVLAVALGRAYLREREYDKSEAMFKSAIAAEPSILHYGELAKVYDARDEGDKVQKLYEEFMATQPDVDYLHAQAENAIAGYYLRRWEWEKALPFAQRSAASGAEWGMELLAYAQENLQQFDAAERTYRAIRDKYGEDRAAAGWLLLLPPNRSGETRRKLGRRGTIMFNPERTGLARSCRCRSRLDT